MKPTAVADIDAGARLRAHWCKNRRMTAALMAVWFVVTFGVSYFARELNFNFFGWPFSFWMAAQGAPVVYVIAVWFYARRMDRLDQQYGVAEDD